MSQKKKVCRRLQGYPDFVGKEFIKRGFVNDHLVFFDELSDADVDMLLDLADDMTDQYFISLEFLTQHYHLIGWEVGDPDE